MSNRETPCTHMTNNDLLATQASLAREIPLAQSLLANVMRGITKRKRIGTLTCKGQ